MLAICVVVICGVRLIISILSKMLGTYWDKHGTPHEKPFLFFGNLAPVLFGQISMAEYIQSVYQKYENQRYVGIYQFLTPALILRDLKLINDITVKDFEQFPQHMTYTSIKADPIWAHNLFAMPGNQKWKDMRATLSPAFTTNKLKTLFYLIDTCAQNFTEHISKQNGFVKLEMKETFSRVTNDIIASTALGVSCNSLNNPENEIFKMGSDACNLGKFPRSLKFFIKHISTKLAEIIQVRFISEETRVFFEKIVKDSIKMREEVPFSRPDIIQLLMEARKGQLKLDDSTETATEIAAVTESNKTYEEQSDRIEITDDILTAQAVVFFLAGFDTSSTAMSFAAYELALHPDIQERLFREITSTMENVDEELNYKTITSIKFLDMVVSEVLRKWPPLAVIDRTSVNDYVIHPENDDELPVPIEKDVLCLIPIYAIHRDPKYYPEPEKFDPERFATQNLQPQAFLPFGRGRRSCIGSRFALLEIKIVLIRILLKFEIVPIEETPIPIVLSRTNVNPISDRGFWLGFKPRNGLDQKK